MIPAKYWSPTKRLMLLGAMAGGKAVEDTATGNPLTFITDVSKPLKSLLIPFTPQQSGTGDPSPQNVRSILPWDGLSVFGGGKNLLDFSVPEADPDNTGPGDSNKRIFTPLTFCKGITANNYFDKEKVDSYNIQGNTLTVENNTAGYGIGFALPLNANKYYSIRCEGENFRANVGYYAKDGSFISTTNSILYEGTRPEYQFSPPNDAYIAVVVFVCKTVGSPAIFRNVQIEAGQTATAYEPYKPITETDIVFPSPVYGGTLEVVSGVLRIEWAGFSSTWGEGVSATDMGSGITRKIYPMVDNLQTGQANNKCNIAPYSASENAETHFYYSGSGSTNRKCRVFLPSDTPSDTVITVITKLSVPQTVQLTPEQITAIKGSNTMWSDANELLLATFLKKK